MTIKEANRHFATVRKEKLGFYPTPLHRLDRLSEDLGVNLYLKRDDFSGINLFGGNKIRKLEYLFGDAVSKGCDTIFTYGATQSNHAMQTVTACRRLGLAPILYLVAVVKPDENDIRSNLLLDKIMGAEIHIISPGLNETEEEAEERSFALARAHMEELTQAGYQCYDIPMGGANGVGSAAFIEGFTELTSQLGALGLAADYVFHATGTGGTMAGLTAGKKLIESKTQIISINVSGKDDAAYRVKSAHIATEALSYLNIPLEVLPEDFHTDYSYYAPGYEIPNKAASEAIRLLATWEGILLDPVYSGKAFAGMLDYIRTEKVPQGSTVVFWHTGGATALFAEKEILGDIV